MRQTHLNRDAVAPSRGQLAQPADALAADLDVLEHDSSPVSWCGRPRVLSVKQPCPVAEQAPLARNADAVALRAGCHASQRVEAEEVSRYIDESDHRSKVKTRGRQAHSSLSCSDSDEMSPLDRPSTARGSSGP